MVQDNECGLCGEKTKEEEVERDFSRGQGCFNHYRCENRFSLRSSNGECVDCGKVDSETELACEHCRKFESRIAARRAGGYLK